MKNKSLLIVGLLLVAMLFTACAPAATPAPAAAENVPYCSDYAERHK